MFRIPPPTLGGLDEERTPLDLKYRALLRPETFLFESPRLEGLFICLSVDPSLSGIFVPWPSFSLASKTFRYAVLALCTSMETTTAAITLEYLAKFFKYMREAIQGSSVIEVLVASFAMTIRSVQIREPLEQVVVHFNGLSSAYSLPVKGALAAKDPCCYG
jgi:hypothetical protein